MSNDLDLTLPSAGVDRLGQATAVEQSRAIAQVQAAAVMARNFPRSTQHAIAEMREACGRPELARRAFFKFPRGGESVTGASVYLARELARIWGNIDYGLNELRRDDEHGQSEMQAYSWDLQTNARSTRTFVIEHARDTKQGRKQLTELRDISDNNNNFGARAVREMIFATLPQWFTDMAQDMCRETLKTGGGVPLPQRVADALAAYQRARVTKAQLSARIGAEPDAWTHEDVTDLEILYRSLQAREITREEAFPEAADAVTADELVATPAMKPARAPRNTPNPAAQPAPVEVTEPTQPGFGDSNEPWVDDTQAAS